MTDTARRTPADKEELRALIAAKLGVAPAELSDEDDLVDWGLDSVTVLSLAGRWTAAGVPVGADDLIADPRIGRWWQLLATRSSLAQQGLDDRG
ncbi:phosphopantetheine-binding protein [Couchioplanes azureus]|uniref:phosphopantetheine-binding protein n=1 Tax=Couchioplanes caeruleus TaxID=56438 RepID=UPI00166FBBAA|nr:phosphopantetheine-binding protein [Couchioplanes caeruleus]GGQ76321.1 hypothetical protein GCM10010166_53150 [Couchioplanes caeruleus subsp. azureus]